MKGDMTGAASVLAATFAEADRYDCQVFEAVVVVTFFHRIIQQ